MGLGRGEGYDKGGLGQVLDMIGEWVSELEVNNCCF